MLCSYGIFALSFSDPHAKPRFTRSNPAWFRPLQLGRHLFQHVVFLNYHLLSFNTRQIPRRFFAFTRSTETIYDLSNSLSHIAKIFFSLLRCVILSWTLLPSDHLASDQLTLTTTSTYIMVSIPALIAQTFWEIGIEQITFTQALQSR